MTTLIERIFVHSFCDSLSFNATKNSTKISTSHVKQALRDVVKDCGGVRAHRIQFKLDQAKTHADLWALRSDLHQLIAQVHGERLANKRINSLVELFHGLIPDSQLTRMRSGFRSS